jgi:hypothetical protein
MKLHPSVIDKFIYLCKNYGGHQHEDKLRKQFEQISLSIHINTEGNMFLVETQLLINERNLRKMNISDIIPMKLHPITINKIMSIYEMYSGHSNEKKLVQSFRNLDLTPYERIINGNDTVLVPTEEFIKVMQATGRRGE